MGFFARVLALASLLLLDCTGFHQAEAGPRLTPGPEPGPLGAPRSPSEPKRAPRDPQGTPGAPKSPQ